MEEDKNYCILCGKPFVIGETGNELGFCTKCQKDKDFPYDLDAYYKAYDEGKEVFKGFDTMSRGILDKYLIRECKKCPLYKTKKNYVLGEGSKNPEVMFVGEAPGKTEDKEGKPFVGKAGKSFRKMLEEVGLDKEKIYITNILKCRPPQNRNPKDSEITACLDNLKKEIKELEPKIIVCLGRIATNTIFNITGLTGHLYSNRPMKDLHGKIFQGVLTIISDGTICKKILVIPLYHPAVSLYKPEKRAELKADIEKLANSIYYNKLQ